MPKMRLWRRTLWPQEGRPWLPEQGCGAWSCRSRGTHPWISSLLASPNSGRQLAVPTCDPRRTAHDFPQKPQCPSQELKNYRLKCNTAVRRPGRNGRTVPRPSGRSEAFWGGVEREPSDPESTLNPSRKATGGLPDHETPVDPHIWRDDPSTSSNAMTCCD